MKKNNFGFLKVIFAFAWFFFEIAITPILVSVALFARFKKKSYDVGLGPEPLINNVYHKKALEQYGYTCETFVTHVYYITDEFDKIIGKRIKFFSKSQFVSRLISRFVSIWTFIFCIWRYQCIYIYFNGGPLGCLRGFLWKIEPLLFQLANVKIVVMPYGGDIQDLTRTPNLLFRHVMAKQYPNQRLRRKVVESKIDIWTSYADHIISGCDWVDYMYYWDTLMLAHFSIDTKKWDISKKNKSNPSKDTPLKILHAPNHREVKGTNFFIQAVQELKAEGAKIELIILEKQPNTVIQKAMKDVDIIADQLIIGWYAMFALEGMAMGKPVLCYLREDLKNLYEYAGIIKKNEIPIINCNISNVKDVILDLANNREKLKEIGERSRKYVEKFHSLQSIGKIFDQINKNIGVKKS